MTEQGIGVGSYSEALRKSGELFGFSIEEQDRLAGLAIQRNRLAHRYLNFRWQAIKMFKEETNLIIRLMSCTLEGERKKNVQS